MASNGNNELDDESCDSCTSDDSRESDFDFDYDDLVDNLNELELLDEDSAMDTGELKLMNETYVADGGHTSISLKEQTPISVFRGFFTEEILTLITDQTNIYGRGRKSSDNRRKSSNWKDVSKKEIESFLGLIILMGINDLPNMKLYWSKDMVFHNAFISSIMSRDRFLQIFYNLHLADNALEPKRESKNYSKIYKVQSFIEILRRTFQENYNFGRYGTIDESMIKFKGRSSLKQYLPLKPIKRGYKVWCLCDSVTGYLFNYKMYLGKEADSEKETLLTERVVFNLISNHSFQGKHLYFDNFFTSIGLLEKLKLQNIKAAGTIRPDRAGIDSDFVKKNKMERGDFKTIIISSSIIFIWMDTKHVFLASNYHKGNEVVPILRRMKSGQRVTINCPQAIKDYNQFSRGVDRFNHRISCYSLDRKSKRNWLRIFIYFLNASISNSFICYNQLAQDKITYLNYMVSVAKSLCSGSERIRRGRPPSGRKPKLASPQTVLTFDNEMHLPVKTTRRRCAYCSTKEAEVRSDIECFTCKLAFCLKEGKNCFFDYHKIFM
jgi:hypothetical protein